MMPKQISEFTIHYNGDRGVEWYEVYHLRLGEIKKFYVDLFVKNASAVTNAQRYNRAYAQALQLQKKLESMWPCYFLAKEWPKELRVTLPSHPEGAKHGNSEEGAASGQCSTG